MWLAEPPLQDPDEAADATEEAEAGPANPWAELPVAERLSDVLQRLRTAYSYCIFCGCQVHSRNAVHISGHTSRLPPDTKLWCL